MIPNIQLRQQQNYSSQNVQNCWTGPDLNPIENLWAIMKKRVEKKVNKCIVTKKKITVDDFKNFIREEWELIDKSLLLNLVNSMPRRIGDVITGKGNKING